ncbi:MAG TPA: glycosyltransferase [Elusimicrobiota bacterium]|nr:glycosyltransferase [Elusimicrobiota bacterium]
MRRASLLVPCWNALELTRVCLERALALAGAPLELVAVDNGSTDGTRRWLAGLERRAARLSPGSRVVVLANSRNRGYPAAMNQAAAAARGKFLVFGNADAAPTRGWLPAMLAAFAAAPRAAAVSPCSNAPGRGRRRGWGAPPLYESLEGLDRLAAAADLAPAAPAFLPAEGFVPGFWLMTTRARLERVGGFDERFAPGGFEDFDLQWRLKKSGGQLGFAGRAYVHHVWFGCARANGLSEARLYGPARRRLLTEKHPETARIGMSVRTFLGR